MSRLDILTIGEALVDLISDVPAASLGEATAFRPYVGGAPANVAATAARLGARAAVVARVGSDGFGALVRSELADAGADTRHIAVDTEPTTLIVVARDPRTPEFIVYRGADRLLVPSDVPQDELRSARAVHSSAFALSAEPARTTILEALAVAHAAGAHVSFDPNFHPSVWASNDDPRAVIGAAVRLVDVVKPSLDDCARLFGPGGSAAEYARAFIDLGAPLVVVTLGADGALLQTDQGETAQVRAASVEPADATGAGDAFWAAFILARLDGVDPEGAARVAAAVAAEKLRHVGQLSHSIVLSDLYASLDLVV